MKLFQITLAAAALAALSMSAFPAVYAQSPSTESSSQSRRALADGNDLVMFNENSHKYHSLACKHVAECKHCVKIKRSDAKAKGGVPCKTCNGGE